MFNKSIIERASYNKVLKNNDFVPRRQRTQQLNANIHYRNFTLSLHHGILIERSQNEMGEIKMKNLQE